MYRSVEVDSSTTNFTLSQDEFATTPNHRVSFSLPQYYTILTIPRVEAATAMTKEFLLNYYAELGFCRLS